jgi:hypothetical protein
MARNPLASVVHPSVKANGSYRHGRYSQAVRAREAAAAAKWAKQYPNRPLDYTPILRELDRIRAAQEQEEYWTLLTKH